MVLTLLPGANGVNGVVERLLLFSLRDERPHKERDEQQYDDDDGNIARPGSGGISFRQKIEQHIRILLIFLVLRLTI